MTLVKRGVFVTHGGGYTMNSNASDAPLRPGAVLTAKPDRVMHTNKADCQCERCASRSATSRSRSDRPSPTDDAPLVPRGVLR